MNPLVLKQVGTVLFAGINLVLLFWAVQAYRKKASLSDLYYRLLPVSALIGGFQVALGLILLIARGWPAGRMHVMYGAFVGVGVLAQTLLGRGTALGQRYRGKPLVHAFLALLVALLALRSWMSVR